MNVIARSLKGDDAIPKILCIDTVTWGLPRGFAARNEIIEQSIQDPL